MNKAGRYVVCTAAVLYAALMLWLLFGQRIGADTPGSYFVRLSGNFNCIPFYTICDFLRTVTVTENPYLLRHSVINLAGNVVMFVPLGFFVPCLWRGARRFWRCVFICILCIACVELLQLFTLLGSCDIDDLILNTVGAVAGYGIYCVSSSALQRISRKEKNSR